MIPRSVDAAGHHARRSPRLERPAPTRSWRTASPSTSPRQPCAPNSSSGAATHPTTGSMAAEVDRKDSDDAVRVCVGTHSIRRVVLVVDPTGSGDLVMDPAGPAVVGTTVPALHRTAGAHLRRSRRSAGDVIPEMLRADEAHPVGQ